MESSEEQERLKKQKFLKAEIIDKKYDANQFKEFLTSRKSDGGSNVDIWTFHELKYLVHEFQSLYDPEEAMGGQDDEEIKMTDENERNNKNENEIKKIEDIEEEKYIKEIHCRELGQSMLSKRSSIEILINKCEIKSGGIFSSPYANFVITTPSLDLEVRRSYVDFCWLKSTLSKLFPSLMIPPLPNPKSFKLIDEITLKRQKFCLEKFLNDCFKNPLIRDSKVFADFLAVADELHYQVKKKEYKNVPKTDNLEHCYSQDGTLTLLISPELKTFYHHVSNYIYEADNIYEKVKKLSKQLLSDLDRFSSTIFSLGDSFKQLYELSNNFNNHANLGKNSLLDNVYVSLNNMMIEWGNSLTAQTKIVQEKFYYYFKYEKTNNRTLKELIQERNNYLLEYEKSKKGTSSVSLIDIKEKISNLFSKDNAVKIKDKFAFYNVQVSEEIKRCLSEKTVNYIKHFSNFAHLQCGNTKDMHSIWADILTHFQEVTGEKLDMNAQEIKKYSFK